MNKEPNVFEHLNAQIMATTVPSDLLKLCEAVEAYVKGIKQIKEKQPLTGNFGENN